MNRDELELLTGVQAQQCEYEFNGKVLRQCPFIAVCTLIEPTGVDLLCETSDSELAIPFEENLQVHHKSKTKPKRRRRKIDPLYGSDFDYGDHRKRRWRKHERDD